MVFVSDSETAFCPFENFCLIICLVLLLLSVILVLILLSSI